MAAPRARALLRLARGWRRPLWAGGPACRGLTLAAAPSSGGSPWRLWGALCLQRPPVVSKALTPLQEEMAALLQQVDVRRGVGCLGVPPGKPHEKRAGSGSIPALAPMSLCDFGPHRPELQCT